MAMAECGGEFGDASRKRGAECGDGNEWRSAECGVRGWERVRSAEMGTGAECGGPGWERGQGRRPHSSLMPGLHPRTPYATPLSISAPRTHHPSPSPHPVRVTPRHLRTPYPSPLSISPSPAVIEKHEGRFPPRRPPFMPYSSFSVQRSSRPAVQRSSPRTAPTSSQYPAAPP